MSLKLYTNMVEAIQELKKEQQISSFSIKRFWMWTAEGPSRLMS